jgi:protein-tyrosine phosphatase
MAEAVIRDRVTAAGLDEFVIVDSAGTGDWHVGGPADPRARATLDAASYAHDHRARQIDPTWIADIDLLLAMDSSNYANLQAMVEASGVDVDLRMFRSFDPQLAHLGEPHPDLDVPDPYYGSHDGFTEVLEMLERAADALVVELPARVQS